MNPSQVNEIVNELKENGIVKIPNYILKKELILIQKEVISELKRLKLDHHVKSGKVSGTSEVFQQVSRLSQRIEPPRALEKYTFALHQILFELFGKKFDFDEKPQLLLTVPQKTEWTLNGLKWHVDSFTSPLTSLQFFLLIDDVKPYGGGTLVLKGSHKFKKRLALNQIDQLLDSKQLNEKFEFDQINMSIFELNGTVGDVYLMDMRLLHSPSLNVSDKIRMMATYRFYSKNS